MIEAAPAAPPGDSRSESVASGNIYDNLAMLTPLKRLIFWSDPNRRAAGCLYKHELNLRGDYRCVNKDFKNDKMSHRFPSQAEAGEKFPGRKRKSMSCHGLYTCRWTTASQALL